MQKHFQYEGHVNLTPKPKKIEILDVSFLTPARIKANIDDKSVSIVVGVDLIDRTAYNEDGTVSEISGQIFDYLDSINSLPEDFFEASEEIYNQAQDARDEHDSVMEEMSNVGQPD